MHPACGCVSDSYLFNTIFHQPENLKIIIDHIFLMSLTRQVADRMLFLDRNRERN